MVCCRDNLHHKKSTIKGAGKGLFTKTDLRKGAFVGFYCGDELDASSRNVKRARAYAMNIAPGVVFNAFPKKHPQKDMLALMNEPPEGKQANVFIEDFYLRAEFHARRGPVCVAKAFYAARDIPKNSELFVHYGDNYEDIRKELNYRVGKPALEEGEEIPQLQDPLDVMQYLPLDCFVALERRPFVPFHTKTTPKATPRNNKKPGRPKTKATPKGTPHNSKRPRGRPPKGKTWDGKLARYV